MWTNLVSNFAIVLQNIIVFRTNGLGNLHKSRTNISHDFRGKLMKLLSAILGDDKSMAFGSGKNIHESKRVFSFHDFVARDFPSNDLAEETIGV